MLSILPTPPLHLSITAGGLVRSSVTQPLAALWSSAAQAFVGAHRASLTLASSRFEVCASLLALGRGCGSLSRLTSARADLKSNAAQLPQHPEAFLRHATYKRYSSTANNFQRQLVRKFKIIAIDNLVDCD
jgi:hypothetical protein